MASLDSLYQADSFPRTMAPGGASPIPYRLLAPEHVEPGQRYPLVLFLHGAGERGSDNRAQLKYLPTWMTEAEYRRKYPCYLLAPQCPANEWWIDVEWGQPKPGMTPTISDRLAAVVGACDRVLAQHPIDAQRQYLTGISMGGFGTWDLAIRFPERWAAALPVCGGGDAEHAERMVNLPIWAFHGDRDDVVPPFYSREMIQALREAGGNPNYTELRGVGHDSWTPAYRQSEALDWMFRQVK